MINTVYDVLNINTNKYTIRNDPKRPLKTSTKLSKIIAQFKQNDNVFTTLVQLPVAESHLFQDPIGTTASVTLKNSAASGDDFLAAPTPSVGLTCVHMLCYS